VLQQEQLYNEDKPVYLLLNKIPTNEGTPLHWTVHFSNIQCTEFLLSAIIATYEISLLPLDAREWTFVDYSVIDGLESVLDTLVNANADFSLHLPSTDKQKRQALHRAAYLGNATILSALIQLGFPVNTKDEYP
jgi:ankyrin repeat protein